MKECLAEKIKRLLCEAKIESYLINEVECKDTELYFVRHRLDQKRGKHTQTATVTVYRDATRGEERLRGAAEVLVFADMTDVEITEKLRGAYLAAEYSYAPYYPLCEPTEADKSPKKEAEPAELEKIAAGYAEAIFRYDGESGGYVSCAEIFASHIRRRTINSRGVDAEYTEFRCDGELVVCSKEGEDVELFDYFTYTGEQYEALSLRVRELLCAVRARSFATRTLPTGEYSLIVEGDVCRELFGYYLWKADAKNVHTGYSQAKLGEALTPSGSVGADITCVPTLPFSREGIASVKRPLLKEGRLCSYIGDMRFCSYINAQPTGEYEKLCVKCGDISLSDMKKEPYLYVVSFSDFQFDALDGYFGGEIRLAYLFDGESVRAVTGGSVSSDISKLRTSAAASAEKYESYNYSGPRALKINGVSVCGSN